MMKTCKDCIHCDICDFSAGIDDSVCGHFKDRSDFLELGKPVYIINQGRVAEFLPHFPFTIYSSREDAEHALKGCEDNENL